MHAGPVGPPHVFLAHGASGNADSMRPWVDGLAQHGIAAHAVGLPRGKAEAAVGAYRAAVEGQGISLAEAIIGGQSYGGRVASLLAAEAAVAGLVLMCYPLHRPGDPSQLRNEHWPRISCPTLLLSGEADPFARIGLLREAASQLADATLLAYPRVGHSLTPVRDEALERLADFVSGLARRAA